MELTDVGLDQQVKAGLVAGERGWSSSSGLGVVATDAAMTRP
jgi:hypothetical protein